MVETAEVGPTTYSFSSKRFMTSDWSNNETFVHQSLADLDCPLRIRWDAQGRWERLRDSSAMPGAGEAWAPAILPSQLGSPVFRADHGVRFAMVSGSMANGIASVEIVSAMARAGMMGYFGAAGCSMERVEQAIDRLGREIPEHPWGVNLIHSPNETAREEEMVELLLKRKVRRIEASAFLELTPAIVHYRAAGLAKGPQGETIARHRVMAKVSRGEVAARFLAPAPEPMLRKLLAEGKITAEQADLASRIPLADDLTAEADSGGHTDNRPLVGLFPSLLALRDRMQSHLAPLRRTRVGAAGGIATPHSVSAALAMGASYFVTGTVNQGCVESGSSDIVRKMLAQADPADVIMAPAADMFEMGIKLQVLKRGTLFAPRAQKLFEIYRLYPDMESIPTAEREQIESKIFRAPLSSIWEHTEAFFRQRDPAQLDRAARDPRHKMALVFRWYLGLASRWANAGQADRQADFQIWCGPAMGAFNAWAKGSHLEEPARRLVGEVNLQLLAGAAVLERWRMLVNQGAPLSMPAVAPFSLETLRQFALAGLSGETQSTSGTPSTSFAGRSS